MKVFATLCLAGAASAYKLARHADGLEVSQLSQKDALMELAAQQEEMAQAEVKKGELEEEDPYYPVLYNMECDWSGSEYWGDLAWSCYDRNNNKDRGHCADLGYGP